MDEPGLNWEGFATGTLAAASGGVTTVVDMPLDSIPATTTVKHYEIKRAAAQKQSHVDVAFWGGIIPGNQVFYQLVVLNAEINGSPLSPIRII